MASEPVGRREAFSVVHSGHFYVGHGDPGPSVWRSGQKYSNDQILPLQEYNFTLAHWSGVSPESVDHEPEEKHYWTKLGPHIGVCCAVLHNCVYTFGGFWKYGYAVHELNLETMMWRRLEPKNREEGPMHKDVAGMVACGEEALCVFGGYGYDTGRHQPGATYHLDGVVTQKSWTNELHVFSIKEGTWSSPKTTGPRPSPCAAFSFTKIDLSRAIVFGGRQRRQRVKELHILDMDSWHWSGAILPASPADSWPRERSLHSACALVDPATYSTLNDGQLKPKLFVLWGTGNNNGELLPDAWILDVNSLTWKPVKLPPIVGEPRMCFSLGCHNRSATESELVLFGGIHGSLSMEGYLSTTYAISDTTLLYLGVKSLYYSCVDYIVGMYEMYQPLLQQLLPPYIHTDIIQERDKKASVLHYRLAQL